MKDRNTELYLIRHGETELNSAGVFYGWTDCGISEKGVMQAEDLADILQEVSFDAVISSTLLRAVITAAIVSGCPADQIRQDERLRELNFGEWEGLHYKEISEKHKPEWDRWNSDWKNASPPKGETFMEFYERIRSCVEDILNEYKGKRVLAVSHHGTMRVIPMVLLGLDAEAYWSFTAEQGRYSHYEIDGSGHCIIRKINSGR
ncbi:MAG TPA: alpha-ribazole phosphatase [Negativicutes bacterium]|nr:alpha-ribazole phosphatase [Negativicutes bacterium]